MYDKILSGLTTKLKDVKFFNPKISAMKLSLSLISCTMQISMAKSLNPDVQPGKIKKGDKTYDWGEGEVFFSCSPEECVHISKNMSSLMKGTYKNPKSSNSNFPDSMKNSITVEHYKDNVPTTLLLSQGIDKNGSSTGAIKVSILHPKGKGNSVTYFLRENELKIFLEFCKHCAIDLPFYSCLFSGFIKMLKQVQYEESNENGNSKSNNNNYSKRSSKNEETESFNEDDQDSSSESASQEESSDEVEDLDFGF